MYCNHCGAELPDGSKFCQDCGTVTKAAAAEQIAKKKVETPPPAPTPSPSDTKKSSKKKVNPLLIAIIIVVIAAVGSLGAGSIVHSHDYTIDACQVVPYIHSIFHS